MDEQQNSPIAGTPVYQQSQEKNAKWLWLLIILIIIGAMVFAYIRGIGPFGALKNRGEAVESPTPAQFTQPSPDTESSPQANLDKSEPKIRVLNGIGRAGTASSVKDFLEGKGWKVGEIGNAPNFDFEKTVIRLKENFKQFADLLFGDLSDNYSVTVSEDDLSATDSADIEIIVGSK